MAKQKILFFIEGTIPTEKQAEFAKTCKEKVCFRNVNFIDPNGCIESCDFVLGKIVGKYKEIPMFGKPEKSEPKKEEVKEIKNPSAAVWKPQ